MERIVSYDRQSHAGAMSRPDATIAVTLGLTLDHTLERLVRGIAGRLLARMPRDAGIEMADLIQAGNLGLIQAARTFRTGCGAPLAGYAKFRIRGEMLDTVRRHSGRGAFSRCMAIHSDPGDADLAESIPAPAQFSPLGRLASAQLNAFLSQAVARLPERQRQVVRLRYSGGLSLREIGQMLRVNESRACQIHRSALIRLRRALLKRGVTEPSHLM